MRNPLIAVLFIGMTLLARAGFAAPEGPPIRTLSEQEVHDLITGSAIVATRGRFQPIEAITKSTITSLLAEGRQFRIVSLDDLPDDWTIIEPAGRIGGGNPWQHVTRRMRLKKVPTVPSAAGRAIAMEALSRYTGKRIDAVIRSEAAGATVSAFQASIASGLPVVDACPTGRAVPEISQSIPYINGISAAPAAFVSRWGDVVVVEKAADSARIEDIGRSLAVASGGSVLMASTAMSGKQAKQALIPGSLTQNILYGRTVREARERKEDPIAALVTVAKGFKLFQGLVVRAERKDDRGFDWWDVELEGVDEFTGHRYRVWVKNENIVSWLDDEPDAMSPDLILPLNPQTGEAIITKTLGGYTVGSEVAMVGIPAAPLWRTRQGIAVLGPRHFGFDFDYVPLEELQK